MFAIMTRFTNEDYKVYGDEATYNSFVRTFTQAEINRLIETTRRTVLYWQDKLFVTGIATNRKDRVGTSIRYSLLLDGPQCENWFGRFVALLDSGNSLELGDALDQLCRITSVAEQLVLPEESVFAERIDSILSKEGSFKRPESAPENEKCWIWSEFCPVNPAQKDVQQFLDSLKNIPVGTWYFSKPIGKEVIKKKTMSKKLLISLVLVLVICLGLSLKFSSTNSNLASQIQVLEKNNAEMSKLLQTQQKELEACQTENKKLREELKRANKPIGE